MEAVSSIEDATKDNLDNQTKEDRQSSSTSSKSDVSDLLTVDVVDPVIYNLDDDVLLLDSLDDKDIEHSLDLSHKLMTTQDKTIPRELLTSKVVVDLDVGGAPILGGHCSRLSRLMKDNIDLDNSIDRFINSCVEDNTVNLERSSLDNLKGRYNICSLDQDRVGRLPNYSVNLLFRNRNHKTVRQVPQSARLDSLADVNWISRRLFFSLSSKYNIKVDQCNVVCRLADKSEIRINQCCNLDLSIEMKNSQSIKISCRFLIMESSQDLVLGWEAIARFNLMQVNVASDSKSEILDKMKTINNNFRFNKDGFKIHSDLDTIDSSELARLNVNVKARSIFKN